MDIAKTTTEITLLRRALKTAPTVSIKAKIKSKITRLKQYIDDANVPTVKLAKALLGSKRKVLGYSTQEFNDAIGRLSMKGEYSFLKGMGKGKIKDDLKREAKPVGYRFVGRDNFKKPTRQEIIDGRKKGTVYMESRANRSDVVRPAKLEYGGIITQEQYDEITTEHRPFAVKSGSSIHDVINSTIALNLACKKRDVSVQDYKNYGKFAKGGGIGQENKEMVLNNNKQIAHHTKELQSAIKGKSVPAWVVAKVNRSASDLSDATHYMEGQGESYADGGGVGNDNLNENGVHKGYLALTNYWDVARKPSNLSSVPITKISSIDKESVLNYLDSLEIISDYLDGEVPMYNPDLGYGAIEENYLLLDMETQNIYLIDTQGYNYPRYVTKLIDYDREDNEMKDGGGVEFIPEKKGTLIRGNEIIKYFEKANGNYRLVFYTLNETKGKVPTMCDAFGYCEELDVMNITPKQLVELIKKNNLMEYGGGVDENSTRNVTNDMRGEDSDDYGTFEIYKNGGSIEVNVVNSNKQYNEKAYNWILGDFDKDGVANADDIKPLDKNKAKRIDEPSITSGIKSLISLKNTLDSKMYSFINELKDIAPNKSKIYARTKTPYSVLDKLIKKRLSTITDLIGTTVVTNDKNELDTVKKYVQSGEMGKVTEFEDMYKSPKKGYRAYHFLIDRDGMSIELQLKTKRQKALNELTHEPYKLGNINVPLQLKMTEVANRADEGDKDAIKDYNEFMKQPNIENVFYAKSSGKMANGGGVDDLVNEGDIVIWENKKYKVGKEDKEIKNFYLLNIDGTYAENPNGSSLKVHKSKLKKMAKGGGVEGSLVGMTISEINPNYPNEFYEFKVLSSKNQGGRVVMKTDSEMIDFNLSQKQVSDLLNGKKITDGTSNYILKNRSGKMAKGGGVDNSEIGSYYLTWDFNKDGDLYAKKGNKEFVIKADTHIGKGNYSYALFTNGVKHWFTGDISSLKKKAQRQSQETMAKGATVTADVKAILDAKRAKIKSRKSKR